MKKLIQLSIGSLLFAQTALAGTQVDSIQQNLTSPIRPVSGLARILSTTEKEPRVPLSSSFFFKSLLKNVESDLLLLKKTGKAVVVDPNMTIQDLEAKIQAQEDHVCNQALNKLPGGIDSLLTTVMFQLMDSSGNPPKLTPQEKKITSTQEQNLLIDLIKTHLQATPKTTTTKSISQLIGEPTKIDFHDSVVRRIQFTRKDSAGKESKLPMSLSMLVSFRSDRDEAFVKVQSCLVNYLKAQQQVFGQRLGEITSGGNSPAKASVTLFAETGLTNTKTSAIHFENLKSGQADAYLLKHFLEGRTFNDLTNEKDFLIQRLAKISETLPYLQERLLGALEAHQLMAQMSKKQMDDLIGMFLQLMSSDLPTSESLQKLTAISKTEAGRSEAFAENYVYFKQLSEDLTSLDRALIEEKISNEAIKQDLENIRMKARP